MSYICSVPKCPVQLDTAGRCTKHRQQREIERGSRQARGYDAEHNARRAALAPLVATGTVNCWRCGTPILTGTAWDLGHDDHDRTQYRGPEHAHCNRSAAGRMTHGLDPS